MKNINTVNELNQVVSGNSEVVIKIGTPCCGQCKVTEQNMEALKTKYSNLCMVVIDAEECDEELLDELNIRGIPTLLCYKDGKEIERVVGLQTMDKLTEIFNRI